MKIEITPEKARKLKFLLDDWAEIFATTRQQYKKGYLDCSSDIFEVLEVTVDDLDKEIAK